MSGGRLLSGVILAGGIFVLSGCSLPAGLQTSSSSDPSLLRSTDEGATFEEKDTVSDQQVIGAEILSVLIDKDRPGHVYVGTRTDGIYLSENNGDTWRKIAFPPTKVYGLTQDPTSPNILYASGVWQDRAKLYRSNDSGNSWKEIYSEPAAGPVITSIAHHPTRSGVLLIGLSTGVLVRTEDGGQTWSSVPSLSSAVTQVNFDPFHSEWLYAVAGGKLSVSRDRGLSFEELAVKAETAPRDAKNDGVNSVGRVASSFLSGSKVLAAVVDPTTANSVYVGTEKDGVWKSVDAGKTWTQLSVLASSKQYPINALAVNPFDGKEILYSGAQAVYKSTDGGVRWSTYQLNTKNTVGAIVFDPDHRGTVWLAFRSF